MRRNAQLDARGLHRKALLGFVLFYLVGYPLLTEAIIRFLYIPSHHVFSQAALFSRQPPQNATFGDSHIMRAFVGTPSMLNFGQGGDGIIDIAAKIRRYYAGRKAFRIILQGSPHMFRHSHEIAPRTYFYLSNDRPLLYLLHPYFWDRIRLVWHTLMRNPTFTNRHILTANGALLDRRRMIDWPPHRAVAQARETVESQRPPEDFVRSPPAQAFIALAEWLEAQGAEVCLLTTPVAPHYSLLARHEPVFARARAWFDALAKRHGFRRLDLFDNMIPLRFFSNNDHINADGAPWLGPRIYSGCGFAD